MTQIRGGVVASASAPSASLPQEGLDGVVDPFLALNLAQHQVLMLIGQLTQLADEITRTVGAFDLPVAEQVAVRQQTFNEQA